MQTLKQGRRFMFTINNPTYVPEPAKWTHIRYCVFQKEKGEKGTEHYQGYVEFLKPIKPKALSEMIPHAHLENAQSTREACITYCTKEDTRIEDPVHFGENIGGQGARTDVWAIKRLVDEGATDLEIWDECPKEYLRYFKGIERVKRLKTPKRDWKTEVHLYIGEPGCGKSRKAHSENPDAYWKPRNEWWCDYAGQEVVIIDDFYGWLPFDFLLRLLDRYPLQVGNKGGAVEFIAKKIILTSNSDPFDWYGRGKEFKGDMRALYRRFDKITHWHPITAMKNYPEFDFYEQSTDQYGQERSAYDNYRSNCLSKIVL